MAEQGTPSLEERLTELETRLAFADDLLQGLNEAVALHDRQLVEVHNALRRLQHEMLQARNALGATGDPQDEPPPPHY